MKKKGIASPSIKITSLKKSSNIKGCSPICACDPDPCSCDCYFCQCVSKKAKIKSKSGKGSGIKHNTKFRIKK